MKVILKWNIVLLGISKEFAVQAMQLIDKNILGE